MAIRARRELSWSMKNTAKLIFVTAQTVSNTPQVSRSAIFSVSEVTRDIIQPSGVLLKYESDKLWRWRKSFLRKS